MKIDFKQQAKLRIYKDGSIQVPHLFISLYNTIPNELMYDKPIDPQKLKQDLIEKYSLKTDDVLTFETIDEEDEFGCNLIFVIFIKQDLIVRFNSNRAIFYYSSLINYNEILELVKIIKSQNLKPSDKRYFHMITREFGSLELQNFEIQNSSIDVDLHYNDDFKEIDRLINKSLQNKKTNGMILLHGLYGTGKTYYLRHLINTINRKFIYLPLHMIDALSSPEFIPFIAAHKNSILILEDCENILTHRDSGNAHANALSNLLNMSDGLLADALSINVICTFNAHIKKIDDALLRKGRMIARYEFKELDLHKTKALAESLGKTMHIEKPLTISEIFNAENLDFQNTKPKNVGFAVIS